MISAVVITKNEENNIEKCLNSLLWCDEIIVIDDYSEDKTVQKISILNSLISNKNPNIQIIMHKLNGDFASQRNFGMEKAKGEWVLFVDADEEVTEELKNEILSACHSELVSESEIPKQVFDREAQTESVRDDTTQLNGFYFKRQDFFEGRWLKYGETSDVRLLRLARKKSGKWQGRVHERWLAEGMVGNLTSPLLHYPHKTLSEFLTEINYYSTIRAKELHETGVSVRFWQIIFYPKIKFLQNYFLKLGFLDGFPGLIMAIVMSFHSFLVRGKLYLLSRNR